MLNLIPDPAPGAEPAEALMLMLPGLGMQAHDYLEQGFVSALRASGASVDIVLADIQAETYLSPHFSTVCASALADSMPPHRYQTIWLAGISMGGYGVLKLLREDVLRCDGAMLLAPFLSTRGAVADLLRAGGLDLWQPDAACCNAEDAALFSWLKAHLTPGNLADKIYLGWGEQDRFADASRVLAARLPISQIFSQEGGHDWGSWMPLWKRMLSATPLAVHKVTQ